MKRRIVFVACLATAALPLVASACGSDENGSTFRAGSADDGGATGDSGGGDGGPDDAGLIFGDGNMKDAVGDGNCGPNLLGTLRDFHQAHPDFEKFLGDDHGIVKADLGADLKPVYASATTSATTTGKTNFDQWYRTVANVNVAIPFELKLVKGPNGISTFNDAAFFPLDGMGFGNEGNNHNFHFTYELHTEFIYTGGEVFTFVGDDDVFVFINNKLAIDLGGVHNAETKSVNLDQTAAMLGIQKTKTYPLAIFQAERHTTESHFRVDTTITFTNCVPIVP